MSAKNQFSDNQQLKNTQVTSNLKCLLWIYFLLLIFEGALRKWFLPQLSTPLLIVRDPVVIMTYFLAIKGGIFPKNIFTKLIIVLAFTSFLAGLATVIIYDKSNLLVNIYGLRTNFLHLFLIFLIPKVFNLDDVKRLGKWVLLLAVPMAILMVYQFNSSPDAFINRIAGEGEGQQLPSALGKIRPPGTFSFITGAVQYFSLVSSFLLYGLVQSKIYPNWLLYTSGLSLVLALTVSGSRLGIGSVLLVLISLMVVLLIKPALIGKSYKFIALLCIICFSISFLPIFDEGAEVLNSRVESASAFDANSGGIVGRFFGVLLKPFSNIDRIPLLGYGLGMGTNVGAAIITGEAQFLLAEGEWSRIVLESGLFLGVLYILLRIGILCFLGKVAIKSATNSNILPLLLFGACVVLILNGQLGQPTTLGFAVLGGGLCLASCQTAYRNQVSPATR